MYFEFVRASQARNGKALSGADSVCVVANPSTPNYIYPPTPIPLPLTKEGAFHKM